MDEQCYFLYLNFYDFHSSLGGYGRELVRVRSLEEGGLGPWTPQVTFFYIKLYYSSIWVLTIIVVLNFLTFF